MCCWRWIRRQIKQIKRGGGELLVLPRVYDVQLTGALVFCGLLGSPRRSYCCSKRTRMRPVPPRGSGGLGDRVISDGG